MWPDLSCRKGTHNLPFIILFGVILAFLMAFLLISVYEQQLSAQVDEQAIALVNELARTAFVSLSGGQPTLDLPMDLGGSPYSLSVQDNSVFVVRIVAGRRSGASFSAVVNANVTVENDEFSPGGSVFFMRSGNGVIVSASPIEAIPEVVSQPPSAEPPSFYQFAKDNPRAAAAIVAVYFDARTRYPLENVDVVQYREENTDFLVQIRHGSGELENIRVRGSENNHPVGVVVNAWVVEQLEAAGDIGSASPCPSVDNAYLSRWLYSPRDALNILRSRTWYRASDNMPVTVPSDALVQASAVTTNISMVYPAWRVLFEGYTIFFKMMPWWEMENLPGFVFQSEPELNPIV